jgi:hypothetical protein
MAISSTITTDLTSLQNQVAAAEPLANASHATIVALQLNAAELVEDIQLALTASSILDTFVISTNPFLIAAGTASTSDPVSIVNGVNSMVTAATDQANLSLMRGVTGRAASNLDQLV